MRPAGGGDLRRTGEADRHHGRPLHLRADAIGVDDDAGVDDHVHGRDLHRAPGVDFDLDHRGDIGVEAAVRGDADAPAAARLPLRPARPLAGHLEHAAQPPRVDRIPVVSARRSSSSSTPCAFRSRTLPGPSISSMNSSESRPRRLRQLVGEAVRGKRVEDVADGAEPADAHVRVGRAVLGADVRDVVGQVGQPEIELEADRLARAGRRTSRQSAGTPSAAATPSACRGRRPRPCDTRPRSCGSSRSAGRPRASRSP